MNGENKFLKIFSLVAFVAFAAVSCWSTTESLFLTLENADDFPKWVLWIAVVGLYVLTSICFKLMLDTFNQNIYMEKRTVKFAVSLLGVVILWMVFSMPTNAHTFFYKQMAKNTAVKELIHIDGELQELSNETAFLATYNNKWNKFEAKILGDLAAIKAEIRDFQNPGHGDKTEARIVDVEDDLGLKTGTIARLKARNNSLKELNKVCEHYDKAIKEQLEIKKEQHDNNVNRELADFKEEMKPIARLRQDIDKTLKELEDDQFDKEAVLKNARKIINTAYDKLGSKFKGLYSYDENVYRSDRLIKVTKVWEDYLKREFKDTDYTLWYWILISIIVDIAAFAFFDIAFKKENY